MRRRFSQLLAILLALAAAPAAGQFAGRRGDPPPTGPPMMEALAGVTPEAIARTGAQDARRAAPVAHVGDQVITVGQLEDDIAALAESERIEASTPQGRRARLESLIRFEVAAAEAARRGFGDSARIRHRTNEAAVNAMVRRDFDQARVAREVTAEEVQLFYATHRADFVHPETRRIGLLRVSASEADELKSAAARMPEEEFTSLAAERATGSDVRPELGWLARDAESVDREVLAAAWRVERPGGVEGPLRLGGDLVLVRVLAIQPAEERTLEQVAVEIRARLSLRAAEDLDALVARLRAEELKETHEERLEAVSMHDVGYDDERLLGDDEASVAENAPAP